ncbi:hypothetical protein SOPP22_06010 [Shewanella sp. OPT22]|nr:hypothetical protein SOPP22_06010 [Shewanella sp. OPT22]
MAAAGTIAHCFPSIEIQDFDASPTLSKRPNPACLSNVEQGEHSGQVTLKPPSPLELPSTRQSVTEDLHQHTESLKERAEKAQMEAKAANLQLKKKAFFIKLSIAIVASLICLGGVVAAAASGGAATPFAVGMGIIAASAIADACCAAKDWHSVKNGKETLPMGANGLGNLIYVALKPLPIENDTRKTAAKWVSLFSKMFVSVGILAAVDFNIDAFVESGALLTPLLSFVGNVTDIAVTHGAKNKATERSVEMAQLNRQQTTALQEDMQRLETNFNNEVVKERHQEAEIAEQAIERVKTLKKRAAEAHEALILQQAKHRRWITFVDSIPKNSEKGMEVAGLFSSVNVVAPQTCTVRRNSSSFEFKPQDCQLEGVGQPTEVTSDSIKDKIKASKQAAIEFKNIQVRQARNAFISKVFGTICFIASGGVIAGGLVISIGDAVHAYQDWQAKKHGKTEKVKPFGWDWIANVEYNRQIKNGMSEQDAKERAEKVSLGVRLGFSLGMLFPAGEQHQVVEAISSAVGKVDTMSGPVRERAEGDSNVAQRETREGFIQQQVELEEEQVQAQKIAHTRHNDQMAITRYQEIRAEEALKEQIHQKEGEIKALQSVNAEYKGVLSKVLVSHAEVLNPLILGEFSDLFSDRPPPLNIVG